MYNTSMSDTVQRQLTAEEKSILSQALWDLNLIPEEFLDIIEGRGTRKWPDRAFCVARLLESVNWFDITKVIAPQTICEHWEKAKRYVRLKSIREGMDFACRVLQ